MYNIMKTYYETNLPHIQPVGAVFFVTFRLADSLPAEAIARLQEEYQYHLDKAYKNSKTISKEVLRNEQKRYFARFDKLLDHNPQGNLWLKKPEIAKIVMDKLHEFDKKYYDLYAYVIMANHIHVLFDFGKQIDNISAEEEVSEINYTPLYKVMNLLKGATARTANLLLGRTGNPFWQKDNYDHYVRNGKELNNIVSYILNNPVKAGIVEDWQAYPFHYYNL